MDGCVIVTYRCNARCRMCNTWQHPTDPKDEIKPQDLESLPGLAFCNITGGEPFIRDDIADFVRILSLKARRVVISTNGYYTEKILAVARKYPSVGIRVSLEGLRTVNDDLRGMKDCFDRGMRTLTELKGMGIKDIGFGITLSDANISDMMGLYILSKDMGMEFATACVHNSYYFHKFDNTITRIADFDRELMKLMTDQLMNIRVKDWFRAYFNYGLLNYAHGNNRLLPCAAGVDLFFIDPLGEVMACNAFEMSMGNIKKEPFRKIWNGARAEEVRKEAKKCGKNCWMVGSVAPAMKKNILKPIIWVIKNKVRLMLKYDIDWRFK